MTEVVVGSHIEAVRTLDHIGPVETARTAVEMADIVVDMVVGKVVGVAAG
jgi:hypothetical protein